jgi:hypothetical protein
MGGDGYGDDLEIAEGVRGGSDRPTSAMFGNIGLVGAVVTHDVT